MMMITKPEDSFIAGVMEHFIKRRKDKGLAPLGRMTQKEENFYKGKLSGLQETIAAMLAMHGTELRRQEVRKLNARNWPESLQKHLWLPEVDAHRVSEWLRGVGKRWDEDEWKDESDEAFYAEMNSDFYDIVFKSDEWREYYTKLRKTGIMAGVVEPDESDREWIDAELKAYSAILEPVQKIKQKLDAQTSE